MAFEVLVAVDLLDGRVVRLRRGNFGAVTIHGADPVATARQLVERGAQWLHVVDLDGARRGRPVHAPLIAAIVRAVGDRAAVEAGGGIRDLPAADALFDIGVERVVIGTAALGDPGLAERIIGRHGGARLAVAIDVRGGLAVGQAWREGSVGVDPAAAIRSLDEVGVEVFEVTAVERDGTLDGPDVGLLRRLGSLGAGRLIASGGLRSIRDLEAVRDAGCAGAILGRSVYESRVDLRAALARLAARDHAPPGAG